MIANAIERVLTAHSLTVCIHGNDTNNTNDTMLDVNDLLVPNGNATCGEVKVDIAITLAFMSGLIMVSWAVTD